MTVHFAIWRGVVLLLAVAPLVYYALATRQFKDKSSTACDASQTTGDLPAGSCIFNDVTRGDTDIPCGRSSKGVSHDCFGDGKGIIGELSTSESTGRPAYSAIVGYDLATGLGSVNATNLFDNWPTGSKADANLQK